MNHEVILCVDDEAIILMSLKHELKSRYGTRYEYETALNAEEAFEVLSDLDTAGTQVILILSDWLMPGMKGDEFLIAVHERYPHIRKIMITGHIDEFAVERAVREGNLEACLKKPWNSSELYTIIDNILQS